MPTGAIKYQREQYQIRLLKYQNAPTLCTMCSGVMSYEKRANKFCSHHCSATHSNTHRAYQGRPKQRYPHRERSCSACNILFCPLTVGMRVCSADCKAYIKNNRILTPESILKMSMGGRNSVAAQSHARRSKDEISLFNMCLTTFPDALSNHIITEGWDADIVIPSKHLCIMWNGPWHYKQLSIKNHSLAQVQNRDNIKLKKFTNLGWKVLVFEDRHYTPSLAFDEIIKC